MTTDLAERAIAGDHEAFSLVAARLVDRLYSMARLILRDSALAEDATQDALVRAWRDIRSVREPARLDAWVYRLLIRSCHAEQRRRRAWSTHVRPLDIDDTDQGRPTLASIHDAVDEVVNRDEIERGMARLTADQRAVLVLHYFLDLSVAEGAAALGVPDGTFKSRLFQARGALRAAIDADTRLGPGRRAEEIA